MSFTAYFLLGTWGVSKYLPENNDLTFQIQNRAADMRLFEAIQKTQLKVEKNPYFFGELRVNVEHVITIQTVQRQDLFNLTFDYAQVMKLIDIWGGYLQNSVLVFFGALFGTALSLSHLVFRKLNRNPIGHELLFTFIFSLISAVAYRRMYWGSEFEDQFKYNERFKKRAQQINQFRNIHLEHGLNPVGYRTDQLQKIDLPLAYDLFNDDEKAFLLARELNPVNPSEFYDKLLPFDLTQVFKRVMDKAKTIDQSKNEICDEHNPELKAILMTASRMQV